MNKKDREVIVEMFAHIMYLLQNPEYRENFDLEKAVEDLNKWIEEDDS